MVARTFFYQNPWPLCGTELLNQNTVWCSEIGSLTSLDACNSGVSIDRREPISLHQAVATCIVLRHPFALLNPFWLFECHVHTDTCLQVGVREMRIDRRKQDHHWFNILAVADRVKVSLIFN